MTTPIEINAEIAAAPATAWAAYTTGAHITGWNFASDDWHCPSASTDLRVGGTHAARMEAKDGSFGFDFVMTYTSITPEALLEMVMEDGRKVRVTFEAKGEGTRVTTVFDPETENPVEMQRDGWQAILNNFKTYTEAL